MDRLTTRYENRALLMCYGDKVSTMAYAIDKLAEYEDLEEQGRLIKLPCKVGTTVYFIDSSDEVIDAEIYEIAISKTGLEIRTNTEKTFYIYELGTSFFFDKEQAEAKLMEVQE